MPARWIERQHPRDDRGRFAALPGNAVMNSLLSGVPARASLGLTPYKGSAGRSLTSVHDPYLNQYRQSPRYKQFESKLHQRAAELGVSIRKQEDAAGVWEGELEPSTAVEVEGSESNIRKLAEDMRDAFNQEAVMVVFERPGPDDVHTVENVDPDAALRAMKEHGISGGRIIGDDTLETADFGRQNRDAVGALANELGGQLSSRPAQVEFV